MQAAKEEGLAGELQFVVVGGGLKQSSIQGVEDVAKGTLSLQVLCTFQ